MGWVCGVCCTLIGLCQLYRDGYQVRGQLLRDGTAAGRPLTHTANYYTLCQISVSWESEPLCCIASGLFGYSQTSRIRSNLSGSPPSGKNRWLPIYSICHAYIQYVCSIISLAYPDMFCGKRMYADMGGLTVHVQLGTYRQRISHHRLGTFF